MRRFAVLGGFAVLGSALGVDKKPPSGCTKKGCFFSYTNPASTMQGRCGEVDAAPRMPDDIWKDQDSINNYVLATIKYYHLEGVTLKQQACERTGYTQQGNQTVSWTTPELMKLTCDNLCDCTYPLCPDVPDNPRDKSYCSLCGPKFNADIVVKFWYPTGPGPAPSPPTAGCKRGACPFSYTNPRDVNDGRCGEVDASQRMPGDIWSYPNIVNMYVQATLKYYNIGDAGGPEGGKLVNAPCNHDVNVQRGNITVRWTTPALMQATCSVLCYCKWPYCPDAPDDPSRSDFCSLCGPTFNQPIQVELWYPKN